MFRILHRIAVVLTICFVCGSMLGLAALAYQQRAIVSPAVDGFDAFKAWLTHDTRIVGEVSGRVIKVETDYAFQLKDSQGGRYHFRLAGIEIPKSPLPLSKAEREWKLMVRSNLSNLILSNEVRVLATYLNEHRSGLGVVYLGGANVNTLLVEEGLAKVKPEYLKGLPLKPYYAFLRAQRRAQERQVGIWKAASDSQAAL